MFIEKEPAKAAEDKKVKQALEKDPVQEKSAAQKELKGMAFPDQVKAVKPAEKEAQISGPATTASKQKDPYGELKRLFSEMGLPDKLVPSNVDNFTFDPSTGTLVITLKGTFSKQFDAENTVSFGRVITGTLQKGSFSGISGISRGSASIVEISRLKAGVVGIRGKLGPFAKTLEFRDEQIPSL